MQASLKTKVISTVFSLFSAGLLLRKMIDNTGLVKDNLYGCKLNGDSGMVDSVQGYPTAFKLRDVLIWMTAFLRQQRLWIFRLRLHYPETTAQESKVAYN